jgi:hypothetical protein
MADINNIKKEEMSEIIDFYYHIQEYGHIFYEDPTVLDEPFKKIIDGINEVTEIIERNYSR